MRRFICILLILILSVSFCFAVFADSPDMVELTYWEWLHIYSLCDCEDHYIEYIGIKTCNAGESPTVPVLIPYDSYISFYGGSPNPDRNFEIKQEFEHRGIQYNENDYSMGNFVNTYSGLNLGSLLTDYISKEAIANLAKGAISSSALETSESSVVNSSDSSVMSVQPVPDAGTAYSKPVLVDTEYAPDPESGSLLSVLYGILGKPVKSYTYSYLSSYNDTKTAYRLELLDYDINWIASFLLLCLVVFCIFKAGGALICKL